MIKRTQSRNNEWRIILCVFLALRLEIGAFEIKFSATRHNLIIICIFICLSCLNNKFRQYHKLLAAHLSLVRSLCTRGEDEEGEKVSTSHWEVY